MANPKSKHNSSRTNRRRAHHALKSIPTSICSKCKNPVLSHTTCRNCGFYDGREIIDIVANLNKKEDKKKSKKKAKKDK
ncbi:MAG: 50S ribosomal protein L32 [Patescibacteria group bacterium]